MRQVHHVLCACLLAVWCGVAGAQGFGSVSSRPDAAPTPVETAETSTAVGVPAPSAPAAAPATPPSDVAATLPPPFSSRRAGENPFLTGSAAVAPPAEASNPFLTGSAAAAAAEASNPFLTGSAARHVASMPGWTAPAPTTAAAAPAASGAAGVGTELAAPAQAGTQPFGGNYSDAIAGPAKVPTPADRILVKKSERRLYLLQSGRVIAEYPIKLGLNPTGPKRFEGDFRTPEGRYQLVRRNPNSEFFLSLEVSYPNEQDLARARELGLPPGGLIMIHGQPNVPTRPASYYAANDWTNGCIAVSNPDMVEIWMRTDLGTPVEIQP